MTPIALLGPAILTADGFVRGQALVISGGTISSFCPVDALPNGARTIMLGDGWLLPGFIDTQVNGGGGVLFNDAPTIDGVRAIAAAHRRFGTTALLPTLISDDLSVVTAGMDAIDDAIDQGVAGVIGIHVEGPFINADKRGIHDPSKLQRLGERAFALLARPSRGIKLVTLAPELAPSGMIRALSQAGVIVAAGHSMATYDQTRVALDEGLCGFTHLFNAMTPMTSREPGMVGAALDDQKSHFGLIVDGHHVHPATLRIATAARCDRAMLVTDAMPPVGAPGSSFELMGRMIHLADGQLRADDGTLAGSNLTMAQAVRNAVDMLHLPLANASAMASGNPARFLGVDGKTGHIAPGLRADLVHLGVDMRVRATWIGGDRSDLGE